MRTTKRASKGAAVTEMPPPQTPFDGDLPAGPPPPEEPKAAKKPDTRTIPPPKTFDLSPEDLFAYWIESDALAPGRLVLYVYRTLPVTDVLQPLPPEDLIAIRQKKLEAPVKYVIKPLKAPPIKDPKDWNRWICEVKGAGDYHFKLNDHHPSVRKTIAMASTNGEGSLRAWDTYPPDLNLEEVVLADEANAAYIRWAKLHGIVFPGDPVAAGAAELALEQEEDMATVVESLSRSNENLQNKLVEMSTKVNAPPPAAAVDAHTRGQIGAVETVVEASRVGMKMMGEAMKQMTDNQIKASDPNEAVRQTIEMAKLLTPPAKDNGDLVAIFRMQLDTQEKNAARALEQQEKSFTRLIEMQRESHAATVRLLEQRLDSLEKQKSTAPVSAEENALVTYKRIRGLVRDMQEEEGGADEGPAWLSPVLEFGGKIVEGISQSMNVFAAARNGQPPAPVAQELPAAPAPVQENKPVDMRQKYAAEIHRPLVDALKQGGKGYEFAAAVILQAGETPYNILTQGGYNGVMQFLQAHPPLWQELISPPIGGALVDKFVGEFLDREATMQHVQILKGGQPGPQRRGPVVNPN